MAQDRDESPPEEIARRRDAATKRALNTPHKPAKELIGKTERAKSQRDTKALRARQSKPKDGATS
jgi:hypothetical protein